MRTSADASCQRVRQRRLRQRHRRLFQHLRHLCENFQCFTCILCAFSWHICYLSFCIYYLSRSYFQINYSSVRDPQSIDKVALALFSLHYGFLRDIAKYTSQVVKHWTLSNIVHQTRLTDSYLFL